LIERSGLVGQKICALNGKEGVGGIVCSCGWYCGRDIGRIGWIWERVFLFYSFVDYALDRSFSVDDDIE